LPSCRCRNSLTNPSTYREEASRSQEIKRMSMNLSVVSTAVPDRVSVLAIQAIVT